MNISRLPVTLAAILMASLLFAQPALAEGKAAFTIVQIRTNWAIDHCVTDVSAGVLIREKGRFQVTANVFVDAGHVDRKIWFVDGPRDQSDGQLRFAGVNTGGDGALIEGFWSILDKNNSEKDFFIVTTGCADYSKS